ncbi:phosphate acyltransferase PlsX [Sansalvadorimonas sp. 2012CJ34-2]|uniref:Phosphate acyltransferase n=1 Tax=Parendozoicomonas callyspongiae TaxID=2942213 RepID=A0ABT0PBM2_9GAMM|nr:phosphate acyltransferase PlsX [Sansalvadorimonas sp. 2012CJ34-2]MCL6268754.1 phosphate acyltransferase PlsX [Sansalvadorimonas sp. 2012CJ34-2]
MSQRKTIALDIMSGDCGPHSRIRAAQETLKLHPGLHLILVGEAHLIREVLGAAETDRITIIQAEQVVTMDDRPSQALRRKQDSSMWRAVEQVAMGMSQACVSAGNTGALMAMGRHLLKTLPGIDRPALVGPVPSASGQTLLLDLGANIDCSAEQLHQFAVLGSLMMSEVYEVSCPRVGLLNVGEEEAKGSEKVRLAQQLLGDNDELNYFGFVEGDDLFSCAVDVVVCDGFPGNVALKSSEGAARYVMRQLQGKQLQGDLKLNLWHRMLAWVARPLLRRFVESLDPGRFNGATLLGLQGVVVKSHGSADEQQFLAAINQAVRAVEQNAVHRINDRLESML